jgi:hypothetical protein
MSNNRNDRDYPLYEIDRNNAWDFDETRFAKHFVKQVGSFCLFRQFSDGCRGDKETKREHRAVEETEGRREERGP